MTKESHMPDDLTHFDAQGASRMVDVGGKPETLRTARASGIIRMAAATLTRIRDRSLAKGDVIEVARLAGIMAAKRTSDLIPLCHPLPLNSVEIELIPAGDDRLRIEARVQTVGRTGVEMEALTAVSVAALTVYDMVKAIDRGMVVEAIWLEEKTGGQSGTFRRSN
jgi:cyclic pyranopterin phosphate synthase